VPGAVGVGVTIITEFVPALPTTVGDIQHQRMVRADKFMMIKVGIQVVSPLQMQSIGNASLIIVNTTVPSSPNPSIGVAFSQLPYRKLGVGPYLQFVPVTLPVSIREQSIISLPATIREPINITVVTLPLVKSVCMAAAS